MKNKKALWLVATVAILGGAAVGFTRRPTLHAVTQDTPARQVGIQAEGAYDASGLRGRSSFWISETVSAPARGGAPHRVIASAFLVLGHEKALVAQVQSMITRHCDSTAPVSLTAFTEWGPLTATATPLGSMTWGQVRADTDVMVLLTEE